MFTVGLFFDAAQNKSSQPMPFLLRSALLSTLFILGTQLIVAQPKDYYYDEK